MVEGGGGASFATETLEGLGIFGDVVGKKFKGDETAEHGVFGLVNDAHSAAAELGHDAIVGNGLANHAGVIPEETEPRRHVMGSREGSQRKDLSRRKILGNVANPVVND